jgi:hypothetical protein
VRHALQRKVHMKTPTPVRLAAACVAVFATLVLFDSVAKLARPADPSVADTLAVAKVQAAPGRRTSTP